MNIKQLLLLILIACSGVASAADKIGGYGIGYTARLVFQKADTQKTASAVMLKTGDDLLPSQQENSKLSPLLVPVIKSNGWCDPLANPNKTTADLSECYGWSAFSQWFLIDLSKLKAQKVSNVWVQISVKRFDDADDDTTDDDLVPALTVWRGQQALGKFGDWYPNKFQVFDNKILLLPDVFKQFWGWTLTPLSNVADSLSWQTASTATDKTTATITQKVALKGGDKDYLTVAVGGDSQQAETQHNVNFKLLVKLSTTKPTTEISEPCLINCTPTPTPKPTPLPGSFDGCGCSVGNTCRHPQMNHCMAISACDLPQYKGQCLCPPLDTPPCP